MNLNSPKDGRRCISAHWFTLSLSSLYRVVCVFFSLEVHLVPFFLCVCVFVYLCILAVSRLFTPALLLLLPSPFFFLLSCADFETSLVFFCFSY